MEKNNKKSDYDFLTESIVNISKAGAYDAIKDNYSELQMENKAMADMIGNLIATGKRVTKNVFSYKTDLDKLIEDAETLLQNRKPYNL